MSFACQSVLIGAALALTPELLGGQFFSKRLGAYGLWSGALGLIIRFGKRRRVHLRLGAEVRGSLPDERYARNFRCMLTDVLCSLVVVPEIGAGFNFGQN